MPDLSSLHAQFLPDVYRYAFLMTGSAHTAAEVLRSTVESASQGAGDDERKPGRAKRWVFSKARELCRKPELLRHPDPSAASALAAGACANAAEISLPTVPPPDDAANAPNRLAAFFALLPEKERTALILFYLYIFNSTELADVLEIKGAELGPLLTEARNLLQQHKVQWASLLAQSSASTEIPAPTG